MSACFALNDVGISLYLGADGFSGRLHCVMREFC